MIHGSYWENHNLNCLCSAWGDKTMSSDLRSIDCPQCLHIISIGCSWCRGVGSFTEYGETTPCGQCEGTGYAHPEYHKEK